jgi:Mrp family chromosome partitioning ATPase
MIVAVLNRKGGSGKTTLATNLAGEPPRQGLRAPINFAAFGRGLSVAGMRRALLEDRLPERGGDAGALL